MNELIPITFEWCPLYRFYTRDEIETEFWSMQKFSDHVVYWWNPSMNYLLWRYCIYTWDLSYSWSYNQKWYILLRIDNKKIFHDWDIKRSISLKMLKPVYEIPYWDFNIKNQSDFISINFI